MRPSVAPKKPHLRHHCGLGIVLLAGIALSSLLYWLSHEAEERRLEQEFSRRASIRHTLIRESIRGYEECVYTLRSLFSNSDDVTHREFLTAARDIRARHPGIQAIEWVPLVPADKRAAVEAYGRRHLSPDFRFTQRKHITDGSLVPVGSRDQYYPILFVDPLAGNEPALGYDLTMGPTREYLMKARETSALSMTPKIRLVQEASQPGRSGIIMAAAVHRIGEGPDLGPFVGFVQIVFWLDDMLGQSWQDYPATALEAVVMDMSEPDPANRHLYTRLTAHAGRPPVMRPEDLHPGPRQSDDLSIGGRVWRCTYAMPPGWISAQVSHTPLVILLGGFVFTLVLGAYFHSTQRRAELIEQEVGERTAELRHTQQLLETDIAKRQATEAELRESRRQLGSILGQLPGMAFRFASKDGQFTAIYISHGSIELTGHTPQEFLGGQVRYDDLMLQEDRERSWAEMHKALASRRAYEVEYRLLHQQGHLRWVLDRGQGVYDESGRLLFLEGLAIDITHRKQAEAEKLVIERKLLEGQKLESLGVLAGGIAHDFNNLLTGIVGNASIARLELPASSPTHQNLHQIEVASLRAAELCQQMLAYAGKGQFLVQRLDLEELVRGTVPLLTLSISKRARLSFGLASGLPAVLADATQLRQIVMNLVVNASDALGDHDGVITISSGLMNAGDPRLRHAVLAPSGDQTTFVYLEVADTGCGMSAETAARIFDPFFTTKFAGRGLGLAAVLGIVRGHQGGLLVESQVGQGSRFTLLLPACDAPAAPKPARGASRPPHPRKGTVLLIDDEAGVRAVAGQMFATLGLQSLVAADGREGLAKFAAHAGDIILVILDLTMPRMSGEETLRELRKLSAEIPVIIMSGYNRTALSDEVANSGPVCFLQKPFTLAALREQMDRMLG